MLEKIKEENSSCIIEGYFNLPDIGWLTFGMQALDGVQGKFIAYLEQKSFLIL